ncbi:MAG: hypothetical protein EB078_06235, partial [Proteobacteria bacterium]|nr:hypothetical protein [Pseudomonadota bacterium]
RFIRVVNKTCNITNGHVLIRRFVNLPDGFYQAGLHDSVIPVSPHITSFEDAYPDIEAFKPPFETLKAHCQINAETMGHMKQVCDESPDDIVYMDANGLQHEEGVYRYPFNFPHPVKLNAKYLGIALVELSQYPVVTVLKDFSGYRSPLIMGVNWGSCVMIAPIG